MNFNDPLPTHVNASGRAIVLTSYWNASGRGNRLGAPGYSYDIVARLLAPHLALWGEVICVPCDPVRIESAIRASRQRGLRPIQFSVLPFHDVHLSPSAPNVVYPFWEFPDVPNEAFDGNPQNNWVATANRCNLVLVGGRFTFESFMRAGITAPVRIVPVPTPDEYFQMPRWTPETVTRLDCPAYVFPNDDVPAHQLWDTPQAENVSGQPPSRFSLKRTLLGKLRLVYRHGMKPLIPPALHLGMRNRVRPRGPDSWHTYLQSCRRESVELSGIVYTSIFSPQDGRKNREDLLSGFVAALRDRPDATLVVKLVSADAMWIESALNYYRTTGLSHRCKVVFIVDYISEAQLNTLVRASTYYLTTTRAEGYCLPLLHHLAAARPGVTPCHTAIGDYFTPEMGFIIASSPERAFWPQDKRIRFKTTWNRLVWPSVIEQIRSSHDLARQDGNCYALLADAAQARMKQEFAAEAVWPRLRDALDLLVTQPSKAHTAA